jgi:hypothetical protein
MFLQIKTPTGYKDLSTIQVGDEVCAFDNVVNKVEGIDLWTAEANDYENQGNFTYYLINNTYKFYKNQSIYVNDVVNHVFMLQIGDIIYDEDDKDVVVTSIEELTNESQFYRLTISGDHTYIVDNIIVHNASRYWVGGGSSVNWNATANTNWAAISGGANNQSVPTSIDDVFFDTTASPATISATITILSFTKTSGYTGTITRSATLTVAGNFTDNTAGAWAGASGLTISAASTMISGGVLWDAPLNFTTAATKVLDGNWGVTLFSCFTVLGVLNKIGSSTLTCTNGITMTTALTGNSDIIITGGTWNISGSSSNYISCNTITIAGNITIGNGALGVGTLIYSSGTVTHTGTLFLNGNCTLNTNGINWSGVATQTALTCILSSPLYIIGLFNFGSGALNFTGSSFGFSCNSLTIPSATGSNTITLAAGITYIVRSSLTTNTTRIGAIQVFTSSSLTIKAILTINQGATCNVLANFTRIDASNGRTIRSFNGTITDSINIVAFTDIATTGI